MNSQSWGFKEKGNSIKTFRLTNFLGMDQVNYKIYLKCFYHLEIYFFPIFSLKVGNGGKARVGVDVWVDCNSNFNLLQRLLVLLKT
jgi:hypothetical protein